LIFFIKNNAVLGQNNLQNIGGILPLYDEKNGKFWSPPLMYMRGVTSAYGWREGHFHQGVDLAILPNEPVLAVFDGIIKASAFEKGYGNYIIISHDNGLETLYGHLEARIKAGIRVKAGQIIALGGNTGYSTGAHLHFEVHFRNYHLNPNWFFEVYKKGNIRGKSIILRGEQFRPITKKFDN
jgi:murein DD-endopeptidase MepM/ murein hydrolase activator NlpD